MNISRKQAERLLLLFFIMLMPMLASAHDFKVDGIYYKITSSTDLTVAVTYEGYSYNSVHNEYCGDVIIPSTITYEGTTYSVMSIERDAFYNCISLESINISEGITAIGDNAFYGCRSLITTTLPNSITSFGYSPFSGCTGELFVNCNIPSKDINTGVFRGSRFSQITIGDKVSNIGDFAFSYCSALTSIVIPEGLISIGHSAYRECENLFSVTIPRSVTSIGGMAFYGCTSLTTITIPEDSKLESIGMNAFSDCNNLTSIIIPKSVTDIDGDIFSGCDSLSSIIVAEGNTKYDSRDNCNAIIKTRINQLISGCSTTIIPESITSIGNGAFEYRSGLISIIIPKNITSIESNAFRRCSNLTSVTMALNSKLLIIESHTFENCNNLASITIPEGVTNIGIGAFSGCTNLTSVIIPESVTSIGQYAFNGCTGEIIVNCNIQSAINSSKGAFYNCKFSKVVIGDKVTSVGSYAFYQCEDLTTIELSRNLSNIGSQAFAKCEELTDVFCYAKNVPTAVASTFNGSYLEYATLHVPANALERYKAYGPWSDFGTIVGLDAAITDITLDKTSVTLTEGEELTLIATIAPDDATDKSIIWTSNDTTVATVNNTGRVVAKAPGTVTITATANDGSEASALCEVTVLPASYVITFLVDEEVFATDTLTCGTPICMPVDPTKEGHTFSGWSEAPETMPANDVAISGTFAINKYLVTFKIGEEVIAADSLEYGAAIVAPEAPEKEGHTFNGWGEVAETVPANDLTYEGSYSVNSYLLIYTIDGETVQSDSVAYGTTITLIDEPTKEGYTFSGWSEAPETMPANDVTISGTFTVNKYLVTFKIDDEVIVADSLEYGAAIVAPEAPEREGHTFNGWGEVAETVPASDLMYEGSYSVNSYLLTYTVDGETVQSDSVAYGTVITLLEEPTKEGYTFSGWSEAPETMPAEDVTISGTFTVNIYKVYYYVGEELVHTAEVAYGEAIPEYIYEPTGEGDIFKGWVGDTYETMPAHDVTYVANITNGIDAMSTVNGQQSTVIYDLTGRKVLDTENLKGGVYIVNGRKVVIND